MKKFILAICLVLSFTSFLCAEEAKITAPSYVYLGQPFIVSVNVPSSVTKCTISWAEHNVPLKLTGTDDGLRGVVLLGADVKGNKAGKKTMKIWFRDKNKRTFFSRWSIDVKDKKYPKESLKVDSSMITPPKDQLDRIKREQERVSRVLSERTLERWWSLPLTRPLPGSVTSVYGKKRYYNGIARSRHSGIDMRASMRTHVKAVSDGMVVLVDDLYFAGGAVYVDHGQGFVSMYFHLDGFNVREGDFVKAGQVIAYSGNSGRVTGPHLHFGVSLNGEIVDPAILLKKTEGELSSEYSTGTVKFPSEPIK